MLKLRLRREEYITINGDITVAVSAIEGNQIYLCIDAPKEIPIVRGTLLERSGGKRPACLEALSRKK